MTDPIQLVSMCNRPAVPVLNQPQLVYILTELYPGASLSQVRQPLNFVLLLDRSGSMAGSKIRNMRDAVKQLIDQLDPSDVISIVTFESHTEVLVPAQPATDKEALKKAVDKIRDAGGTRLAQGLQAAVKEIGRWQDASRVSRIVVLTDGDVTDKEAASRAEADRLGGMGIPIIGMGFGKDWNENFLQDIADRSLIEPPGSGAGEVHFIAKPEDAVDKFQLVFQSMQMVARNVQSTIRLAQGLETRRVWQVLPMIRDISATTVQGRAIVIPVGDLEKGGAQYIAEIMLPPRPAGLVRIAQTDVTYDIPGHGTQRQSVDLVLNFAQNQADAMQFNGQVMNLVERVQAFKLQTQALRDAESGNAGTATRKLRQAVTILLNQGETELAEQLQQEANQLEQSGQISNEGKKTIRLSNKTRRLS